MDIKSLMKIYPHDLNLYNNRPSGTILLSELECISDDRLKVLKLVERVYRKYRTKSALYCKNILISRLKELGLTHFVNVINGPGCKSHSWEQLHARRTDHLSHFMLRSAFSFNLNKKKWFYLQELRLFKWRCTSLDNEGIKQFFVINRLNYIPISNEEKDELREYLQLSDPSNINNCVFYKVPFTSVTDLIGTRRIFVRKGIAYVPEENVDSLLIDHLKKTLMLGFKCAREVLADTRNDCRMSNIFHNLSKNVKLGTWTMKNCERTTVDEIDKASKTSFPLCMRRLHEGLKATHHLTNGGRLQYGLFIKGLGISLDEALAFWRNEFLKKFDEAVFVKEYQYGIRHQFGVEGRRADYQPFNCTKILQSYVGLQDFHGCPYKHLPNAVLEQKLFEYGLSAYESSRILTLCSNGEYQSACTKYFEITHRSINDTFNHPNDYYNASRQQLNEEIDSGEE